MAPQVQNLVSRCCAILTPEHRRMIKDSVDLDIISQVRGMSDDELKHYSSYEAKYFRHFMYLQRKWTLEEKNNLRDNLHHEPTSVELIEDMEKLRISKEFRAYYVIRYPLMVRKLGENGLSGNNGNGHVSPEVTKRRNGVDPRHAHYRAA